MSTVLAFILFLQVLIILPSNAEEQCAIKCNEQLQQLKFELQMKDELIEDLIQQINQLKSKGNIIIQPPSEHLTCNDVPKALHSSDDTQLQCIHECIEPHSCSDVILSCYPYTNCVIKCIGTAACHHLQIDFIQGPTLLQCHGFNSCKSVTINAMNREGTYTIDEVTKINKVSYKLHSDAYTLESSIPFEWYLPNITFDDNIVQFNGDNIVLSPHFIVAKNVCTADILDQIRESQQACDDEQHSEHREFGGSNYEISGHTVTFMDDCVSENVYAFMKSVTVGMLEYVQKYNLHKLKEMNVSANEYISENWFYDWQNMLNLSNALETRVIEYIAYSEAGNLGWHTDDGSNFTMVLMLSDESSFDGGMLKFRYNMWDENEYEIKLHKNDFILFPSIADHSVTPITNGQREVLVFEWWGLGRSYVAGRTRTEEHLQNMDRKYKGIV